MTGDAGHTALIAHPIGKRIRNEDDIPTTEDRKRISNNTLQEISPSILGEVVVIRNGLRRRGF